MVTTARKLLDLLTGREKIQLGALSIGQVCVGFMEMAGVASIMPFIAVVANPGVIQSNHWLKLVYDFFGFVSPKGFLFSLGVLVFGMLLLTNLLKALMTWFSFTYDNRLASSLARRLLASYLSRPYEFFLTRNTVDMGKNVFNEAKTIVATVLGPSIQLLSGLSGAFFILILLLLVNPSIAVTIAIVLGGSYGAIYLVTARRMGSVTRVQWEANTLKFKLASEALSGIKDLRIRGRAGVFLERFSVQAQRHAHANAVAGIISALPRFALETVAFGGILLIVLLMLGSEQNTSEVLPILALYAFAGYRLLPAIQQIFSTVSTVRYNLPALACVHQDLKGEGTVVDPEHKLAESPNVQPLPFRRNLVLRGLSYGYPGTHEPALKEMNLTIVPNTSIGLVGATGSGKTTTVDLILGLLTPTFGQLLVDDIEITSDNIARWRRNLGYVPQQIFLSDDTITHNIAFGVPEQEIDMAAVIRAARIANLHKFIEKELSDGYDTVIGERGVRLSGGQRQRIGIARAMYDDPAVLIMDEATSALDGVTEEAVMEALHTLSGEKTVIIIAHRLTTVKECHVIYLMEAGHIVSQGTHDELLTSSLWFKAAARTGP